MRWIHLFWTDEHTELMGLGELPGLPREQTPSSILVQGSDQECSFPQRYRTATDNKIPMPPEKSAVTQREQQAPGTLQARWAGPGPRTPPNTALKHFWDCHELGDGPWKLRDFLPFFPVFPTNASSAVTEASSPAGWAELSSQSCVNEQLHSN